MKTVVKQGMHAVRTAKAQNAGAEVEVSKIIKQKNKRKEKGNQTLNVVCIKSNSNINVQSKPFIGKPNF